mmetsp:Transcript_17992/g.23673  ORF Transcript_17992/g.23673 Transcript_17992/m.23673 type:complete len:210 (-) Transcript_17992:447-1076(-)
MNRIEKEEDSNNTGHNTNANALQNVEKSLAKFQAIFRGQHSRDIHSSRVRRGLVTCPHLATPASVVRRMVEGIQLGPADLVLDLGCGKGLILVEAAKTGAHCIGFDIDNVLLQEARRHCLEENVGCKLDIVLVDVLKVNLRLASVVMVFLVPSMLDQLADALKSQLLPGSKIVSYRFPIQGFEPYTVDEDVEDPLKENSKTNLFFYEIT